MYLGKDLLTKQDVIVKVNAKKDMNDHEFEVMKEISGTKGFPIVYDSGVYTNQPYIIQNKLGLNLNDLLKRNKKHFSLKCVVSIGISLLGLLEKLHGFGYIHCDIKPDNIMIGNYKEDMKNMNQIYLIDFGISSKYMDDDGNHIKLEEDVKFKGNIVFSSKNAFIGKTLSRRDDIISLMYLMIYLIDSKLRWLDSCVSADD